VITHPIRRGEVVQSEGSEGWTVYEPVTDSLHILNASAKAIWELCDGNTSPSEMATAISELTGVEIGEASRDVAATLQSLRRLGLVSTD
jgi:hypothetical protein